MEDDENNGKHLVVNMPMVGRRSFSSCFDSVLADYVKTLSSFNSYFYITGGEYFGEEEWHGISE